MNKTPPVGITNEIQSSNYEPHRKKRRVQANNTRSSGAEQPRSFWGILPEEMMMEIFKHLGAYDLGRINLVNHTWNRLANDEQLRNQFWKQLGLEIGIPKNNLKENPKARIKQEIEKIKRQAIAAGIVKPSLNTPAEINHAKLQIDYEKLQNSNTPHNTPPESIQNLLNDRATPENLAKLERWLLARSTVIVYEGLKRKNNNLTHLDADLLEGEKWERILKLYAEWSKENQSELQNITELNITGMMLLKLPEGAFDHFENLVRLYLILNQLSELPQLDKLTSLNVLYLSSNQLLELPQLDKLTSLQQLDLSNNQLSRLPEGAFNHLENLAFLNLSNNQLSRLPDGTFNHLENLEFLNLSNNIIGNNHPDVQKLSARIWVNI